MIENTERIKLADAARILGLSQNEVRANMRRGVLKIGKVIPPKTGKTSYQYIVYKSLLDKVVHGEKEEKEGTESGLENLFLEMLGELKEIKHLLRQRESKR